MVARRAQVLPDREHLDAVLAQDAEGLEQLLLRLAEPRHQAGLRDDLVAAHLPGVPNTRHERRKREPRRASGYRRGTVSTLWLKTSGRSAITRASGISSPRKW